MSADQKQRPKPSPYSCNFCRQHLEPVAFEWSDYLRIIFLLRPFQCPHCFSGYIRPFSIIGRLPLIGLIFRGRNGAAPSRKNGVLPHRDGDINGPAVRFVSAIGRLMNRFEKLVSGFFGLIFRAIWFLPSLVLGRKKRRSSRDRFLKSLF